MKVAVKACDFIEMYIDFNEFGSYLKDSFCSNCRQWPNHRKFWYWWKSMVTHIFKLCAMLQNSILIWSFHTQYLLNCIISLAGYWNSLPDYAMHIFESLEKAIPIEEWNMDNVYEVIKVMLEDHLLRISEVFDEISINHWTRATKQDVTSRKLHR